MTTIVKAHRASDFLALVPQVTGFQPHNSIVFVAFRGNRTCGAIRFDLPHSDASARQAANTMIGVLCKLSRVDAVVPIAYTDDRFAGQAGIPHADFLRAVVQRAERSGFLVRDALCVAADGWGSYLDGDCPAEGRPLGEIAASGIADAIPTRDRVFPGRVADRARLPEVDLATKESVARLYRGLRASDAGQVGRPPRDPVTTMGLVEFALDLPPASPADEDAALLLWHVQDPSTRDAAMLQLAFGPSVGLATIIGNEEYWRGDDSGARESAALMFGEGPRPDPARIERALELLGALTARAPVSARPAPLCMLGWLSWALGRGSVAGIFVEQALAIDPDYRLAQLLITMLDAGRLPEWAFA